MTAQQANRQRPLTPRDRAYAPHPQGFPVVLGDGQTWTLAHGCLKPRLLGESDEIFDDVMLTKLIPLPAALRAAFQLLIANYNITEDEAYSLIQTADIGPLATAVADSLLGPETMHRTWSMWVLSAFYSNGIEPSEVPSWLVPEVMLQLVKTGRAMSMTDYIDSVSAGHRRSQLLDSLPPPRPAPAAEPAPASPGPSPASEAMAQAPESP